MDIQQGSDLTRANNATRRITDGARAAYNTVYAIGQIVKVAALDLQAFSDCETVVPTAASATDPLVTGVVSEDWKGFDGNAGTLQATTANTFTSYANVNARGTQSLKITTYGYHPAVLVDNSNAGAANLANGVFLHPSATTAGKAQGMATAAAGVLIGYALLPSAGLGASLTKGAIVAASQTFTIGGVPAAGDVYTGVVQIPFAGTPNNLINPGVAVTRSISTAALTGAQAASTTTAAAAFAAALNADTVFAKYYTAAAAAAVVTVTLNAGVQFFITTLNGNYYYLTTSGSFGNNLTFSASAVGGGTNTAGGATLAGGVGYVGTVPAFISVL